MMENPSHCAPTWNMPNIVEKHATPLISLQQEISRALRGRVMILANEDALDVVPSRMK